MKQLILRTFLVVSLSLIVSTTLASGTFGPDPESKPSVFTYAFFGLGVGSLAGLSIGYLVIRSDGYEDGEWRPLVIATSIGLLSGIGLGLTVGTIDLFSDKPGVGGIILRDMLYGELLGIGAGLISGGISAIAGNSAEHLLFGSALGCLIGSGVGLIFGIIEGRVIMKRHYERRERALHFTVRPSLTALERSDGSFEIVPAIAGTF